MKHEVKIYVTMGCPFCRKLMEWLAKYKVEHSRVIFEDTASKMAFYAANPGVHTVPQIFVDGERLGGWSDLQETAFKKNIEANFKG